MPSFLPWLLETPQAGDKGFGKSPPRDVLLCLKWGRKISLQPLAGGFEVPGTQCPAPSPLSPPPMEELESRVPSFINHTRTQNFFFFYTPPSSSCKNCKVVMFLYPLWVSGVPPTIPGWGKHPRFLLQPVAPTHLDPHNQERFLEKFSPSPGRPALPPAGRVSQGFVQQQTLTLVHRDWGGGTWGGR